MVNQENIAGTGAHQRKRVRILNIGILRQWGGKIEY